MSEMDPENPVVKLCAEGMRAEGENRFADARALFLQAWEASRDDYDACVAAHFVARHQDTPEETLRWNREALARADAAGGERVRGFYPSLYLNLAHAHEQVGDLDEARRFYARAAELADALPDDRYGGVVRGGIAEGKKRIGAEEG
ncbi:MAG TPA: tetratricopeptide repeat protein [Longimicrobium sp.]|nr:tetratricopeptide repeat protein [Longimicrobium sp.]